MKYIIDTFYISVNLLTMTMYLQHSIKPARKSNSKHPQTHRVPELTYIAAPFFSLKERKLRTNAKNDTFPSKTKPRKRPQSARGRRRDFSSLSINNAKHRPESAQNNRLSSTHRTASDISKLHRTAIAIEASPSEQQRDIRKKIRNLFSAQLQAQNDCDGDDEEDLSMSEDEDFDESDIEEMSKQKQMELTHKVLQEKVQRLKEERLKLESEWNAEKYQLSSTKMVAKEMNALKRANDESESDSDYDDDDESLDSIMTFSDNDGRIDSDDSNEADAGIRTLSHLRKKQTSNLARIERKYNWKDTKSSKRNKAINENDSETKRPKTAPTQGKRKESKHKKSITVPKPFEFDERDKQKAFQEESISKRRFREWIESIQREEDNHLNMQFKANPVPLHTVTSKLKNVHGLKGKKVKKCDKKSSNEQFIAKEVPWFVKVKLFDAMKKEENTKRKDRIKERANKLLSKSSLPPRMQLYENKQSKKAQREKMKQIKKEHFKEYTFQPKINHNVPDFKKEQQKFQEQLQSLKRSKPTVKSEGFSFCDKEDEKLRQKKASKKEKKRAKKKRQNAKSKEQIEIEQKLKESQRKIKWMIANPPKIIPKSTKKFDAAVQSKKEKEKKEAMMRFLYEEEYRKKDNLMKSKWKGVLNKHLVDNTSELEKKRVAAQREAKEQQKEMASNWKRFKKEMRKRIQDRPLLVEEERIKMEQERAKKKSLTLVFESLKQSGIQKFDDFFDEMEMEKLQKLRLL